VFPGDTVDVEVDGIGRLSNTIGEVPAPTGFGFRPATSVTSLYVVLGSDFAKRRRLAAHWRGLPPRSRRAHRGKRHPPAYSARLKEQ
jgi:hypothetical protein